LLQTVLWSEGRGGGVVTMDKWASHPVVWVGGGLSPFHPTEKRVMALRLHFCLCCAAKSLPCRS
jgi:hypothetical protein